ncbi:hypothetical protein OEA41_008012 [Lepraria neglecta]|uniref:GED domain-containing protein n=1 Tax=Lepraria neglecta TaxID=209136 RepID=A0AAD9ZE93_9LECA|nr:hypothetical protein OEA41_008012 [Lepraria neglecta]
MPSIDKSLAHDRYLVRVGKTFSSLIKAAIDGVYAPTFFGDAMTAVGYSKRLRAVIQNLLLQFAEDMRLKGQERVIIDDDSLRKADPSKREISRSNFIDNVLGLVKQSRGRELPGTFNPLIVGDLFYQYSNPWKSLVDRYSEIIIDATRTSLEMAVAASADVTTCEGLLHELLYPALSRYSEALQEKVAEILRPHQQGHPITYNHYFTETVQKARQAHEKKRQARQLNAFFKIRPEAGPSFVTSPTGFNTGDLLNTLNQSTEADMDRHAYSEAVDCMEAYYKARKVVAMNVLVDNFSVLVVENCVISDLANCLSPERVMMLDDVLIGNIAAETEDPLVERRHLSESAPESVGPDADSVGESLGEDGSGRSLLHKRDSPIQEANPSNDDIAGLEKPATRTPTVLDDSWHNGNLKLSSKKKNPTKSIFADEDVDF